MSMTSATNATGKRKRAICQAWVSAGSGQFTINVNKAPTAPVTVKVAYFVISAP